MKSLIAVTYKDQLFPIFKHNTEFKFHFLPLVHLDPKSVKSNDLRQFNGKVQLELEILMWDIGIKELAALHLKKQVGNLKKQKSQLTARISGIKHKRFCLIFFVISNF